MTLRIGDTTASMYSQRMLGLASTRLSKSMERLSSGLRINRASDDAAGLTISKRMEAEVRGIAQARRNVQDGIGLVRTAEGALQEVQTMLHRGRDLAVQWNNDVLSLPDRQAILDEWAQISNEIGRISDSTNFNGVSLLNSVGQVNLQVGAQGGETVSVTLADIFGGAATSIVRPATFFVLPWLEADLLTFDAHVDDVAKTRSMFGGVENRLEYALSNLESREITLQSAQSLIADVDVAEESIALLRSQVTQQSSALTLLQADIQPRRVLQLLEDQPQLGYKTTR